MLANISVAERWPMVSAFSPSRVLGHFRDRRHRNSGPERPRIIRVPDLAILPPRFMLRPQNVELSRGRDWYRSLPLFGRRDEMQ